MPNTWIKAATREAIYTNIRELRKQSPDATNYDIVLQAMTLVGRNPQRLLAGTVSKFYHKAMGTEATNGSASTSTSAHDKAIQAVHDLKEAIRGMEHERTVLQQKQIDLDNLITKYKTLL
jgi:hypothetical protein